jgi:hypothetical protein
MKSPYRSMVGSAGSSASGVDEITSCIDASYRAGVTRPSGPLADRGPDIDSGRGGAEASQDGYGETSGALDTIGTRDDGAGDTGDGDASGAGDDGACGSGIGEDGPAADDPTGTEHVRRYGSAGRYSPHSCGVMSRAAVAQAMSCHLS